MTRKATGDQQIRVSTATQTYKNLLGRGEFALAAECLSSLVNENDPEALPCTEAERDSLDVDWALCQCILGNAPEAVKSIERLEKRAGDDKLLRGVLKTFRGWLSYLAGDPNAAEGYLRVGLDDIRATGTEQWVPEASRWLGYVELCRGNCTQALQSMFEALGASVRRSDTSNEIRSRIGLAHVFRTSSRYEEAIKLLSEAQADCRRIGASTLARRVLMDLSVISRIRGDLKSAKSYCEQGLAHAEELQEDLSIYFWRISLHRIESAISGLCQSRELLTKIIESARTKELFQPLFLALEDRGDLAFQSGSLQDALTDYDEAFQAVVSPQRGEYPGELAWRIGLCHLHLRSLEKAHTWINRGLDICEKTGDAKELAVTIRAHGLLLLEQGNVEGGFERLSESLRRLQRLGVPFEVGRCHLEIAKASHRFTRDRKGFDFNLETAEDIFRGMGAGLGLRWTEELRQSSKWESNSTAPVMSNPSDLISETLLGAQFRDESANRHTRLAATTLEVEWKSPQFVESLDLLRHFARSKSPLLITGETGAGKTAFAEVAHVLGANPREPFLVVNCASLPETLLESELFGHVRGAFTGAERDKAGLIRSAGAGTIFLDEVDKASSSFQANLLHVLDRREIRPVGSHTYHEVRARFVLATNRDLTAMSSDGTFLSDLEFRISGLRVDVPALRDRIADFDFLLALALRELRLREGIEIGITVEARNFLSAYNWPGNVRELFSVIAAAGLLSDNNHAISMNQIERVFRDSRRSIHVKRAKRSGTLAERMEELEKEEVLLSLRLEGGSQSRAAAKLGMTRRGLNKMLHRLGLLEQLESEGLEKFSFKRKEVDSTSSDDRHVDTEEI